MRFVLATRHFAGLGFALRLQEEGREVLMAFARTDDRRLEDRYALVGNGMIPRRPLADVMRDRTAWRDAYWMWDADHSVDEIETLRSEHFRVLGGAHPQQRRRLRTAGTEGRHRDERRSLVRRR